MKNNIAIILVRPQLGENIGMVARAMLNFGFDNLSIVSPRDGWPNEQAIRSSAHANRVIENAKIFKTIKDATQKLEFVYASSARKRDLNLQTIPLSKLNQCSDKQNKKVAILFGPENSGLSNDDLSHANQILTIPVNPNCPSINIAASVAIICYELSNYSIVQNPNKNTLNLATRGDINNMCEHIINHLENSNFYKIAEKKTGMIQNFKNIFNRTPDLTKSEINSLIGIFKRSN